MKVLMLFGATLLTFASNAAAFDFPNFPHAIKIIESDELPIELIKVECMKINEGENVKECITNTMNHWSKFHNSMKQNPNVTEKCYESLKELDDYILVNNCIDAAK